MEEGQCALLSCILRAARCPDRKQINTMASVRSLPSSETDESTHTLCLCVIHLDACLSTNRDWIIMAQLSITQVGATPRSCRRLRTPRRNKDNQPEGGRGREGAPRVAV